MIHDAPPLSRRRFAGALGAALGAVVVPRSVAAAASPAPGAAPAVIDLSSNENPYGPSPAALEAMTRSQAVAGRYPDAAEQAATSSCELGPPAMGAWMIGRRMPSRSQSGVCNLAISIVFSM